MADTMRRSMPGSGIASEESKCIPASPHIVSRTLLVSSGVSCNVLPSRSAAGAEPSLGLKDLLNRRKAEFAYQAPQARLATDQVRIVPEARQPAYLDAWLIRVNLPWMQVKDERNTFGIDPPYGPSRDPIRPYAEIAATGDWQSDTRQLRRRRRKLHEAATVAANDVGSARRIGNAIQIMAHWKYAGIIDEASIDQGIERPQ